MKKIYLIFLVLLVIPLASGLKWNTPDIDTYNTTLQMRQAVNETKINATNFFDIEWSNIVNKFITAVDNYYIYMSGTTVTFNETKLNATINALENDTHLEGNKPYLYNDSTLIYFNESKVNQTITFYGNTTIQMIGAVNNTALNGTNFKSLDCNNIVGSDFDICTNPDTNTDTQDLSYDAPTDVISLTDGGSIDISEVDTNTWNTSAEMLKAVNETTAWINPVNVIDIDKEDIETDLNTFVDIAGDIMTGDLQVDANINSSGDINASGRICDSTGCIVADTDTNTWNTSAEMILAVGDTFVNRSGDTMTGTLEGTNIKLSNQINSSNAMITSLRVGNTGEPDTDFPLWFDQPTDKGFKYTRTSLHDTEFWWWSSAWGRTGEDALIMDSNSSTATHVAFAYSKEDRVFLATTNTQASACKYEVCIGENVSIDIGTKSSPALYLDAQYPLKIQRLDGHYWDSFISASGGHWYLNMFRHNGATASGITIDDQDQVGIGTVAPAYDLDVEGDTHSDNYYSGDGSQGLTQTISVRKGDDSGACTLTVKDGLITATTC